MPIARGNGAWLYDFDGKRYLDGISSWWTNLFGHTNPRINAALKDQLETLEHVMLAGFTHAPVVDLSERLSGLTGLGHAFYGSDGASATEIADFGPVLTLLELEKGWGGTPMDEYKRGIDSQVTYEGKPCVFIESLKGNASGFGGLGKKRRESGNPVRQPRSISG